MKGSHRIIVESRKVKYDFVIRRNISFVQNHALSVTTYKIAF